MSKDKTGLICLAVAMLVVALAAAAPGRLGQKCSDGLIGSRFSGGETIPRTGRDDDAIDVVLVVVDTLRADFTGPYGERLPTTPTLDQLSAGGVTFTNAFSAGPWTVPAMFSMMTGLYPSEHGVKYGHLERGGRNALPEEAKTLAERMKAAGYDTFAVNTNMTLGPPSGLAQGFDHFLGRGFAALPFPNLALESLVPRIKRSERYFLWLHYFDPHQPFFTQSPWFGRWNDSGVRSYTELVADEALAYYRKEQGLGPSEPVQENHAKLLSKSIRAFAAPLAANALFHLFRAYPLKVTEPKRRFLEAAYRSEIRLTDEALGEALASLGVDDQTLVIFTSDHGEELFDHGAFGHHYRASLYQELIRVPLVIRLPGGRGAGAVIDAPVSTVDLVPTILELVGASKPRRLSGRSLVPLLEGREVRRRTIISEVFHKGSDLAALVDYPWKYVHNLDRRTGELYNLVADPGEEANLARSAKPRARAMKRRLMRWKKKAKPRWRLAESASLSSEERAQLRALGYLSSTR